MSVGSAHRLTVLVPTHNRYVFLARLLRYYASCGAPFPLRILDSSSQMQGRAALEPLLKAPHVVHVQYDPEIPPINKVIHGLQAVTTPYVVFWADDDFLVPTALLEAVRLLDQRPDVSVVHGQSAMFHLQAGRVQWVAPYLQRSVVDETASARLLNHLGRYCVMFYSLHRTEALTRNLRRVHELGLDWHTWSEVALSGLAVIQGKAVALPRLYMVREGHDGMGSRQIQQERGLDLFDWLTDTAFSRQHGSYETFRDCLVPELVRQDGVSIAEAREVVKRAFWPYLARYMREKWLLHRNGRCLQHTYQGVRRRVATRLPGLKRVWRRTRSWIPRVPSEISLDALRQPWSRYYEDFTPVYRAIVNDPS